MPPEARVYWQGRQWTSKEWREYLDALARSEEEWKESTKEALDKPIPDIKIDGKPWGDYTPVIKNRIFPQG